VCLEEGNMEELYTLFRIRNHLSYESFIIYLDRL